jgi:hypothetical protein
MPQSTDHGIKGNPNDGNDNNASGSGGGEVKRRVVVVKRRVVKQVMLHSVIVPLPP